MRKVINYINRKTSAVLGTSPLKEISQELQRIRSVTENIQIGRFLNDQLFEHPRYKNSNRVTHFHRSVYTQNGEDGIIGEIFNRLGTTNTFFVEFGVHGVKNNSTYLLVEGWSGLWIGGDATGAMTIKKNFRQSLKEGKLLFTSQWITRENIESILEQYSVPQAPDFLSIDLDGNDFWIWKAIQKFSPRVVCIEYNATFPPGTSWVMEYNPGHQWDETSYFGASLTALENLGREKGYVLVGCDFTGCNAFFVRQDQNLERFASPFTAENHYEPPRYFLSNFSGHQPGFGPFLTFP